LPPKGGPAPGGSSRSSTSIAFPFALLASASLGGYFARRAQFRVLGSGMHDGRWRSRRPESPIFLEKRRRSAEQQCTDPRSGSRDRPLVNMTHVYGHDSGMKSTKAQVMRIAATAPEAHHNLRAASAFAISFRTPYLWNGTTKNR
jgi:hypothetical protein